MILSVKSFEVPDLCGSVARYQPSFRKRQPAHRQLTSKAEAQQSGLERLLQTHRPAGHVHVDRRRSVYFSPKISPLGSIDGLHADNREI